MILDIVGWRASELSTKCDTFVFDDSEKSMELAINLVETMRSHGYPSIAANEIGETVRVIALESHPALVMFNPVITKTFGEEIVLEETDVSRKGLVCKVKRPTGVRVRFQDVNGDWNLEKYVGMTARQILHSIDTVDGLIFYNKATMFHRQQALKRFKKLKG